MKTRDSIRRRGENALQTFRQEYAQQHQTKLNRRLHLYGRIIRGSALIVVFFNWIIAAVLFVTGYLVQFLGHAIEGTSPSFFRNPKHLLLGSLEHVVQFIERWRHAKTANRSASSESGRTGRARALPAFVRWVLPKNGCSLRLWTNLAQVLVYGRQSVYSHFKAIRITSSRKRLKTFLNGLALAQVPRDAEQAVPVSARLLARLLRTIYLTEVLPRKDPVAGKAGPNQGYVAHPHFTYGPSLGALTRASTRDGHRD